MFFVHGHYLLREINSFKRAELEVNFELQTTDNFQGQISELITHRLISARAHLTKHTTCYKIGRRVSANSLFSLDVINILKCEIAQPEFLAFFG